MIHFMHANTPHEVAGQTRERAHMAESVPHSTPQTDKFLHNQIKYIVVYNIYAYINTYTLSGFIRTMHKKQRLIIQSSGSAT